MERQARDSSTDEKLRFVVKVIETDEGELIDRVALRRLLIQLAIESWRSRQSPKNA
jgi:hypothetical protein